MPHYCEQRWLKLFSSWLLLFLLSLLLLQDVADAKRSNANLTACQHLRRAESRRAKAIGTEKAVRIPRCRKTGEFESIQCTNERTGEDCWCIDEYGVELPGTRSANRTEVQCQEPAHCAASACRMFCPSGFARDAQTGCSVCRCRDPCDGLDCPNGQTCQLQEVQCKSEPCPPVPTCKKARNLANYCPAGLPLAIEDSVRPFLCGQDAGKPQCPPLYQCMVESGNDYGVCCPSALTFQKPGVCPSPEQSHYTERTGYMCGSPCSHDLECPNMDKCCFTKGCQYNCQQAGNVTGCHQAKALSDVLAINEREGRGYVPDCNGPGGQYSPRQCSRNGLVCWCVDPRTGHKIKESMGAANSVNCDGWENMISRSYARSFQMEQCDTNICAAVCEYGFKNDHNGCPTCECSEPCEGFKCALGSHCEVATDPLCESGSSLCASWPVCKPDLAYSNPCDVGTPLSDTVSGEVMYCFEERQARSFQPTAFFEPEAESKQGRAMSNHIMCPEQYKCTKLHRETESVCCPVPEQTTAGEDQPTTRQQTMCEYLRDFSERMEGTEAGMQLAMPAPRCTDEGDYAGRQCQLRKIKVTRAEQRQILEENTIRRMRMLLSNAPSATAKRNKRESERLKLYRVDDSALKVQVAPAMSMGRSAKVIDMGAERQQSLGQLFETDLKKVAPAAKRPLSESSDLVEMEVEQCWCVDGFGTEIPQSRGYNVSDESCQQLRQDLECLDLTCRMGCEYGFALDANTRCPACQCRDPCEGVTCGDGKECRIVDVSCDGEYCPPVPACLPRKPGQCPYLVPPGPTDNLDANVCAYECRTDAHCEGSRRCCSNGCGTQCVEPQLKTACQHLQAIQLHQSSELGIPARQMTVAQCDAATGKWEQVQCSPDGQCWCVDAQGQQLPGTKVKSPATPICTVNSSFSCPETKCNQTCESGYQVDGNGCATCSCRNYCDELNCASDEECQLISVECVDSPCPKMPICVPRRASVCAEGNPLQQADLDVSCGPHNEHEACPTTHTCQLNPVSNRGVCCSKTRDVCFESMDNVCLASSGSEHNSTRYRFSPKANKCLPVTIDAKAAACQTKNLFHNELACNSVCPVLTQCERLKLKNSLAAQRSGHSSVWFQPRCDPVTGHWSPVQCLGKQPALPSTPRTTEIVSRAFARSSKQLDEDVEETMPNPYGVCWCADRKGAPLKGTLTRDIEPICNSRQARNRKNYDLGDPLMEQLISQLTQLNDIANEDLDLDEVDARLQTTTTTTTAATITERVMELANSLLDSQLSVEASPMQLNTTRCRAMAQTATFPVDCDESGAFRPLQCNGRSCWCVDAAGNQLQATHVFGRGDKRCEPVPIEAVSIELHMMNTSSGSSVRNVYDVIRRELLQLLGDVVENLRVQENFDGSVIVRFELHNEAKVDMAFAIETAISTGHFQLVGGHFRPDLTRSHFVHRTGAPPVAQAATAPDESVQLAMFVMASCSAFLVSVFVVYVMLKRGWHKTLKKNAYDYPKGIPVSSCEKPLEYSLPIFVLDDTQPESIKCGKA